jgi:hypothetical protein
MPDPCEVYRGGQHATFYSIAFRNYCAAKQLDETRTAILDKLDNRDPSAAELQILGPSGALLSEHSVVAIMFAALSVEAFINHYGITHLTRPFFKKHLDRMSIRDKWVIIPRLTVGKAIDTNGQPYQRLCTLFTLRDKLVHFKSPEFSPDSIRTSDIIGLSEAENAIEAVRTLVAALNEVDPLADRTWVRWTEEMPGVRGAFVMPKSVATETAPAAP